MLKTQESKETISDSEWKVMRVIWTLGQAHSDQIIRQLQSSNSWSESTIKTLMRRLVQKGLLQTRKDGRRFIYQATVNQTSCIDNEANHLLDKTCDMHKGQLILQMVKDSPISKSDLAAIKRVIDQKAKTAPDKVPCNCLGCNMKAC